MIDYTDTVTHGYPNHAILVMEEAGISWGKVMCLNWSSFLLQKLNTYGESYSVRRGELPTTVPYDTKQQSTVMYLCDIKLI